HGDDIVIEPARHNSEPQSRRGKITFKDRGHSGRDHSRGTNKGRRQSWNKAEGRRQKAEVKAEGRRQKSEVKATATASRRGLVLPLLLPSAFCLLPYLHFCLLPSDF
ncbi:MAG: hypothetical protein LC732_10980, partial [Acidobacteria bacterium]|nr:hypothetical protein [Acidobacteriota bacterium]